MIVDSLIASVQKYFSTLSVESLWGDSKVSLVIADEDRREAALYIEYVEGVSSEEKAKELILELDATESIAVNSSKTTKKHASESHQVFIDGVKVNPTRVTIVAHIDATKTGMLEKFSKPNVWMYILHTKSIGGSIAEIGYHTDAKLYHILTVASTDVGYKNTIKVQIELEEVIIYEKDIAYKYGVKQTNNVSGSGAAGNGEPEELVDSWFQDLWGG